MLSTRARRTERDAVSAQTSFETNVDAQSMNIPNQNPGLDPELAILLGRNPPLDMLFPVLRHLSLIHI
jgi:hypothetical protein